MDILYDFCLHHGMFAFLSSVRLTISISLTEVSLSLLSSFPWIYIPFLNFLGIVWCFFFLTKRFSAAFWLHVNVLLWTT